MVDAQLLPLGGTLELDRALRIFVSDEILAQAPCRPQRESGHCIARGLIPLPQTVLDVKLGVAIAESRRKPERRT